MRLLVTPIVPWPVTSADQVERCADADDLVALVQDYLFDAVVLDGRDISLLPVIRGIRDKGNSVPIIAYTMTIFPHDLLNAGADYVHRIGVASGDELVASVQACVRRVAGHAVSVIGSEQMSVNLMTREVVCCGHVIALEPKEFDILAALVHRKFLPKWKLIELVWGSNHDRTDDAVKVYIARIRNKLQEASNGLNFIATRHHEGYQWLETPVPAKRSSAYGKSAIRGADSMQQRIMIAMKAHDEPMTIEQLDDQIAGSRSAIYRTVHLLATRGKLRRLSKTRPQQFALAQV